MSSNSPDSDSSTTKKRKVSNERKDDDVATQELEPPPSPPSKMLRQRLVGKKKIVTYKKRDMSFRNIREGKLLRRTDNPIPLTRSKYDNKINVEEFLDRKLDTPRIDGTKCYDAVMVNSCHGNMRLTDLSYLLKKMSVESENVDLELIRDVISWIKDTGGPLSRVCIKILYLSHGELRSNFYKIADINENPPEILLCEIIFKHEPIGKHIVTIDSNTHEMTFSGIPPTLQLDVSPPSTQSSQSSTGSDWLYGDVVEGCQTNINIYFKVDVGVKNISNLYSRRAEYMNHIYHTLNSGVTNYPLGEKTRAELFYQDVETSATPEEKERMYTLQQLETGIETLDEGVLNGYYARCMTNGEKVCDDERELTLDILVKDEDGYHIEEFLFSNPYHIDELIALSGKSHEDFDEVFPKISSRDKHIELKYIVRFLQLLGFLDNVSFTNNACRNFVKYSSKTGKKMNLLEDQYSRVIRNLSPNIQVSTSHKGGRTRRAQRKKNKTVRYEKRFRRFVHRYKFTRI